MSIEDTLRQAKAAGLYLNNLCQMGDGRFQANFTNNVDCWEYARHLDAGVAVLLAFQATQGLPSYKQPKAAPYKSQQYTHTQRRTKVVQKKDELNLDDLD